MARVEDGETSQPWTAARCDKLLRQLESRLATLRKVVSEANAGEIPARQSKRSSLGDDETQGRKRIRYTYRSRTPNTRTFSGELHDGTRHRSVRTLGELKASTASSSADQDHLSMPTYRTVYGYDGEGNVHCGSRNPADTAPQHLLEEMQCLRNSRPERRYRIYAWIFDWLGELLQSTRAEGKEAQRKSLLAMCLRRVPACVDDIEAWDRRVSPNQTALAQSNTSGVSLEIYGQLESLGHTRIGWRPLKHAIRAHGISVLTKAVSNGLFEPIYVALLVRLCAWYGCFDEASSLAFASPGPLPPPRSLQSSLNESSKLQPLRALLAATTHAKGKGYGAIFDGVSNLLKEKRLLVAWIPTKAFSALLLSAVEAVAEGKSGSTALDLLATAMEMLFADRKGRGRDSHANLGQHALLRIVANLATAAMDESGIETGTTSRKEPCRRLLYAMDRCIERVDPRPGAKWQGETFVLHLARFLAGGEVRIDSDLLERYIGTERQGLDMPGHPAGEPKAELRQYYSQTLHLVCTIAHGRMQGRRQDRGLPVQCLGHTSLLAICHKLGHLPLPRWFLQGLIREGAILMAQQTKDRRNVTFSECQEIRASPVGLGWHWEEGIGEWVMRSPGSKKGTVDAKHGAAAGDMKASTEETEGPVQPQTRRHSHQTDPDQHDKANGWITAPEGDPRRRTSACGPASVRDGPVPHPSSGKVRSNLEGKPATASEEQHGKVDEHDDHATSQGALDPDATSTVSVVVHGHQRLVEGSKSRGRSKPCADAAEGGQWKMMEEARPPIGKRRKLLIVRGPRSQRPVHDAHWSEW